MSALCASLPFIQSAAKVGSPPRATDPEAVRLLDPGYLLLSALRGELLADHLSSTGILHAAP